MNQSEKLDLLLKGVYEVSIDSYVSFGGLVNNLNLPIETFEELRRLVKRLEDDGMIYKPLYMRSDIQARLSSYGIDYCEGDSYSQKGSSLISNIYQINVENSNDTTIVSQSENVEINTKQAVLLLELIKTIEKDEAIPYNSKSQIISEINRIINL